MKIQYLVVAEDYQGALAPKKIEAASFEHAAEEFAHFSDSLSEDKSKLQDQRLVTVTDKHGVSKKIKVTAKTVRKYQSEVVGGQV